MAELKYKILLLTSCFFLLTGCSENSGYPEAYRNMPRESKETQLEDFPHSVWTSEEPAMTVYVGNTEIEEEKVELDYLGERKIFKIAYLPHGQGVWLFYTPKMIYRDILHLLGQEPEDEIWYQCCLFEYAEEELPFCITIEEDEMIWYDFSYITGKDGGNEQIKKYEEVKFKREG